MAGPNPAMRGVGRRSVRRSRSGDGFSAACSRENEHGDSADHRLLVLDLTVLPRGERVPFVSRHRFTAKNVADDAAREELIARTGRMAVPVITIDDEVVVGFDRGRLQRLLGIR